MKFAVLACAVASAAAFAPAQVSKTSVATKMSFEDELGVQPPLGYFDPLGMLSSGDQATFDRLRYVEIKHGRICQLAFLGYLTTWAGIRLPGDIDLSGTKFADIPAGFASITSISAAGIAQIVGFIGMLEVGLWKQDESSFPGDFGGSMVPVGFLGDKSADEQLTLRAQELNQGRAAQMGILGLMVHEQLDGKPFIFFDL
jgi:hypothetical protein